MSVLDENLAAAEAAPPQRVRRHLAIDRLYHWVMAIAFITLIYSAFWPTVFQNKTVVLAELHWIAGVILVLLIAFHIVRALFWQDWRSMMVDRYDIQNIGRVIATRTGRGGPPPTKAGKYNGLQKLYHFGVAVLVLSIAATGVLMLFKITTPAVVREWIGEWPRNPYMFEQNGWDLIYALHGLAGMAMVAMFIIHIYFAVRPDEWHLTRSMFRGWISRDEYLSHFDRRRWTPKKK